MAIGTAAPDDARPATPPLGAGAAHLGLVVCMFCWGVLVPAIYVLLRTWDAYTISAVRYLLAAPLMLAVLRWREAAPIPWVRLPWLRLSLLGAVGIGGLSTFMTLGLAFADPLVGIVVQASGPIVSVVVARFLFREALPRGIVAALALAVPGALLAMLPRVGGSGAASFRGGELLIVLGSVCWAWYSLACQRWLPGWSQLRITALTFVPAAVALAVVLAAALGLGAAPIPPLGGPVPIALMLFVTLSSACLGVLLWNIGVQRLGLSVAALYLNLVPVFAVLAALTLGIRPSWPQLLGGLLVLAGVVQLRLWRRRPAV
jgi:drug/metabolite transporter (DMT)-like permease